MAEPLPARLMLTVYRGDSRVWQDTFSVDGEPMDLTGCTLVAQIRSSTEDLEPVAVMDIEVLDAEAGHVRRTLPASESAKLVPPRAFWDYQLIRASGFVRTYIAGPVKVVGDVSRA